MLNTKGLVALTEYEQVSWNWSKYKAGMTKITRNIHSQIWFYFLMNITLLQLILILNKHWLDP